jgi:hypothetical protein
LKRCPGANAVQRIRPLRALSQVHGIVVSICEAESNRNPAGCLETQRVDQLLAEQAHSRGTEDDHALLMQSDDPLVGPKVEQFRKVKILALGRFVAA